MGDYGSTWSGLSDLALYGKLATPAVPTLQWNNAGGYAELSFLQPSPLPLGVVPQYFYTLQDQAGTAVTGHTDRQITIGGGGATGDGAATPYVYRINGVAAGMYAATLYYKDPALGGAATQSESAESAPKPFGERGLPNAARLLLHGGACTCHATGWLMRAAPLLCPLQALRGFQTSLWPLAVPPRLH